MTLMLNPEVLRTEAQLIRERPEMYYQGTWFDTEPDVPDEGPGAGEERWLGMNEVIDLLEQGCDTMCCLAGGIALSAGYLMALDWAQGGTMMCALPDGPTTPIKEAAMAQLIGPQADANEYWDARHAVTVLFYSSWGKGLTRADNPDEVDPERVAEVLERIADAPDLVTQTMIIRSYDT